MSPEQVEGRPLDPRSDIYSFGVTCYHMLAGQPPFYGDTALSVAVQHLKTQPPRLENVRADLPSGLCRIIHKMLSKDPAGRYSDARELLRDLRPLVQEAGADDSPDEWALWSTVESPAVATERLEATQRLDAVMKTQALQAQKNRRRLFPLIAGVAAAIVLGAAVGWLTREPFLLAVPANERTVVERKPSAESQYNYAMLINTEAAWQAVNEYYPSDARYGPLAQQQLARLYLREHDYAAADPLLANLAQSEDKSYRGFALAGQSFVYAMREQLPEAKQKLADLSELAGGLDVGTLAKLLDRQTLQMVAFVGRRIRQFNGQQNAEWEQWLRENLLAESDEPPE
jgi:serine/threonine-protein kinase